MVYKSIGKLAENQSSSLEILVNYAAETFMNLAKPYFENFMEKLEVYGTRSEKWKPRILRKIPASQLPPVYGGNKDWKPLPFK